MLEGALFVPSRATEVAVGDVEKEEDEVTAVSTVELLFDVPINEKVDAEVAVVVPVIPCCPCPPAAGPPGGFGGGGGPGGSIVGEQFEGLK